MVKAYSREPEQLKKAAKAQGNDLRVHYKNTYETCAAIRGLYVTKARAYLQRVLAHTSCVPFKVHNKHVGRTGQASQFGLVQGRWPEKSVKVVLTLLDNLEANAHVKGLNVEKLVLNHVQVNQSQKGRRRTFRAHGRINPYLNHPCNVELWAQEKAEDVKRESNKTQVANVSKRAQGAKKLQAGEQ